jgi:hypothetical protein
VDLAAVVLGERRAQQTLMLAKHLGIAAAQPRQQPRRTLGGAEHERDGPTRELRHTSGLQIPRSMHSALDVLGHVHADVASDDALKVSSTPATCSCSSRGWRGRSPDT